MASVAFLLILVRVSIIRKSLCDSRIVGVFEEDEPRGEGRGHSSDHLIPDPKFTGSRCLNSIWESERRRKLCPESLAGISVTGLDSRALCQHGFGRHPNPLLQ